LNGTNTVPKRIAAIKAEATPFAKETSVGFFVLVIRKHPIKTKRVPTRPIITPNPLISEKSKIPHAYPINILDIHIGNALEIPILSIARSEKKFPIAHMNPEARPNIEIVKGKPRTIERITAVINIPEHIRNWE
jgi:hypothetical protein